MEETRYYLNGIYLHKDDKKLISVATDGHRLARTSINLPSGADLISGSIIPRKAIYEIRKLIEDYSDDEGVLVSLSETKIRVCVNDTTITSKLIDGNFPDYEKVIPKDNNNLISLDCIKFSESVDRVSTIFSDKSKSVRMSLSENKLTLEANSPDTGSAIEEIELAYSNEEISIGFNSKYIMDMLNNLEDEEISINLKDIGPNLEINKLFPDRCNITLAEIKDSKKIFVKVWERGAGLTKACGSAACATAFASKINGLTGNEVDIEFELGNLSISINKNNYIKMKGAVSNIKSIEINL